ncbi:MAG: aldolase catalytic domain-containing protein [Cyclobacteriaceae bacterium]|nr:aldolase catalytic domain-containing protein [Cyclobacteriaceae bacterium]MCH8516927.1 aldolase catalytic domain-containing protein [Cyclobacteriaceae bacterium]
MTKILDCTLRDGGYYTNWDFSDNLVDHYLAACNDVPIDYLEVGYRSPQLKGYLGKYFYLPLSVMQDLKAKSNKKLVIILNEKDVKAEDTRTLLQDCIGIIDMVRLAIDPKNFERALGLARAVKEMGFEVGFNVMYMSTWKEEKTFLNLIPQVEGICDYFYMVDSFGGVFPEDVKEIIEIVRSKTNTPLGFHGHNNLELGLINTLTAIEHGVEIVDATITGMGRGAGNLKTELLLTVLHAQGKIDFDYNALSGVVDEFAHLQKHHEWGTNLPYMVSGAHSLPQKQVMEWVTKRFYSINSILRALSNQSQGKEDNKKLPEIHLKRDNAYSGAFVVGGGPSVRDHAEAIESYLKQNPNMLVIHASSRNAMIFRNIPNDQIFCLIGNEGHRLEEVFGDVDIVTGTCILPPFPREMGTYIPQKLADSSYELKKIEFTDKLKNTHTALAVQTALELDLKTIQLVGYDGYSGQNIGSREQELFLENEYLFEKATIAGCKLHSLTPSSYTALVQESIYGYLI